MKLKVIEVGRGISVNKPMVTRLIICNRGSGIYEKKKPDGF